MICIIAKKTWSTPSTFRGIAIHPQLHPPHPPLLDPFPPQMADESPGTFGKALTPWALSAKPSPRGACSWVTRDSEGARKSRSRSCVSEASCGAETGSETQDIHDVLDHQTDSHSRFGR